MLRPDVLDGRAIALAGDVRESIRCNLERHGARVELFEQSPESDEAAADWARELAPLHVVVYEAGDEFHADYLEACWAAVRAVATGAMIPGERGGRVVIIGPPPGGDRFSDPCRAAMENLARTLSIEWARYSITSTMIAPGVTTTDDEVADLVGYLSSPAGVYFSGCRFDLGSLIPNS